MVPISEKSYQEALKLLPEFENNNIAISIPAISRKLRLSFTEGARLMERLEQEGFVTSFLAGEPRKILKVM